MSSSLSSLVDNLSEVLHNKKCRKCKSYLQYISIKDNKLICKSVERGKVVNWNFNKNLINRFPNTNEFCNKDINKFILLLRKDIYPYEYMDSWERFGEALLPNKGYFHSNLNVEYNTKMLIIDMQKEYLKALIIKISVIIMICMFKVIHYYLQMYWKTLEINALKYMNLILLIFYQHLN